MKVAAVVLSLAALPAMAQPAPSAKEILAAYCFGVFSAITQFSSAIAENKCGSDLNCRDRLDPTGNSKALDRDKGRLFAYLVAQGDPKRSPLRDAVAEGAQDQTRCTWSDVKNKVGCPSFCARRSDMNQTECRATCEKMEGTPRDCAAAEKCSDLSWLPLK
jgi:hypothetical protein